MFKDLNDFIAALDRGRELARIPDPVSPDLEICAVDPSFNPDACA